MIVQRKSFLTWMLAVMTMIASMTSVAHATYTLGSLTGVTRCPEPGVVLNDGVTCY
jgi:hypothetical protein